MIELDPYEKKVNAKIQEKGPAVVSFIKKYWWVGVIVLVAVVLAAAVR